MKAMEAFPPMNNQDSSQKERIYAKIERNMELTLSDVNMKYYERLSKALFKNERYRSKLWDKVEEYVIRNLGMDYDFKTFCEIFKAFALSHNGTLQFYEIGQ